MRLYTVCVEGRPVLVLSTDVEPPMEDHLTTNAALMQSNRDWRDLKDLMLANSDPLVRHAAAHLELDQALDTGLGEDLMERGLWRPGDRGAVRHREPTEEEAARWHASRQQAVATGEQDAGDEAWLVYL